MVGRIVGSSCAAALLSFTVGVAAQTTSQAPTQSPVRSGTQGASQPQTRIGPQTRTDAQLTVTGCVMRESEYRNASGSGRGGALGTGAGVGNEFVLTKAMPAATASTGAGAPAAIAGDAGATSTRPGATPESAGATSRATGTTGTITAGGLTYSLTGDEEKNLEKYVGQRVEIVGRVEGSSTGAAGATPATQTGDPSPAGATATAGSLQRLNVISFRAAPGPSCN